MTDITARYPKTVTPGDSEILLRYMTADDAPAVLAFAQTLPAHDLLFLKRDITEPKVLAAWLAQIEVGSITSLLALRGDELLGVSAVVRDDLSYSSHVGDLRVLLSPDQREQGLGRLLIQESFLIALAQGLEKLVAHMTADQEAAIAVFQGMGFKPEALLRDHVRASKGGETHDLVILGHNVAEVQARMEQYGMDTAV